MTYAELNRQVAAQCARLTALGVKCGERVAVLLDRSLEAVRLVHACARLGTVLVPLNTRLMAAEMQSQIDSAACRWVFSTLEKPPLAGAVAMESLAPVTDFENWLGGEFDLENDFGILFTSGTTGRPKGAVLTWGNLFWSATASAFRLGVFPDDRWLLALPLYHIGGLSILFRSALYGSAVVLPAFPSDQFDLAHLWTCLHESSATLLSLVPTMLYRLLNENPAASDWPASLRLILLGGAAAPAETLARALAIRLPIAVTYGLSEAASQVATATPHQTRRKPGTVGRPLPWVQLRVVDADENPLPAHEIGELQVRGKTVMRGYLHLDAGNGGAPDRWLATGDLGYCDDDGDWWVVQRRTDLIVSGGENIYPAEIEAILCQHHAVEAACVVGIPHPEWGQQVAAAVVLRPGRHVLPEALQDFCRQRLAGFKVPRRIVWFESLPQTPSGKVSRVLVKEQIN